MGLFTNVFFPVTLSTGIMQMVQQVLYVFQPQSHQAYEIRTPGNAIINFLLQFFSIQSQQLIKQVISSLILMLSVIYVARVNDKVMFKRTVITCYSFLVDPIIILTSARLDTNNQSIQSAILASSLVLLRYRPQTKVFITSAIILSIFDPVVGLLYFLAYILMFDQFSFRLAGYSSIVLLYHAFMKMNGLTLLDFLNELTTAKQNQWVIYKIVPDNQATRLGGIGIVMLLILPNLASKHKFTYEKCYYLFIKTILLTNLCTLFFINMPMLQTATLMSMQLAETNIFYVIYATFIQISLKTSTTNIIQIKLMYIAIFLLQCGTIAINVQFLQIKVLTLKTLFMVILIIIPVSIYVFSLLSKFVVLKILQESFSVLFAIISIIHIETKFWNISSTLVSHIIQGMTLHVIMSNDLVSQLKERPTGQFQSGSSARTIQKSSTKSRNYSINELDKYIQTPVSERYEQQINKLKMIRRIEQQSSSCGSYQQQVMDSINRSQIIKFEPISPEGTPHTLRMSLDE